ncbi:hypothetical protein CWB41_10510 [Methylovirgula ligni]|nr:hypothetical protein CWB41_10510 [Methylovirgula ligni]
MEGAAQPSERPVPMSVRVLFPACLLIAGLTAPVWAETANPPPDAAKPEKHEKLELRPGVTSKGYGSWSLRCEAGHTEGAARTCEVSETVETESGKPVAKISVGRHNPSDPLSIIVILPTNVSFPSTVHIRTDNDDKWGLELEWQRCIPGACIASADLSPATVAHWSNLDTAGKIVFRDAAGDEVGLPMSLRGFGNAYEAFNK